VNFIGDLFAAISQEADELMYRAEGANPAAEKSPEDYRYDYRPECAMQRPVEFAG
jgi:hypothetical protein